MQPAFLGGLFIGVLSALPIISVANCCCLWIVGGGALAAYLTQQGSPQPITPGRGAVAGLLAGVIGAIVWLVVAIPLDTLMAPIQERMVSEMIAGSADMPPEVRAWLEMLGQRASGPLRYVFGFVFQLLTGVVFATLGGVLGAVFARRDRPPALGGGPTVPPPLP
jgi:hypothetical protein